jgi:UPF0755 protein
MLRKIITGVIILLVLLIAYTGWQFFSSNTAFSEKSKWLFIRTGQTTYADLIQTLKDSNFVKSPGAFNFLGRRMTCRKN